MDSPSLPTKTGHSAQVTISTMDFSPLLASMRSTSSGEGMTTAEICKSLGKSKLTVRAMLKTALQNGTVRRTEKLEEGIDGRWRPVPAFVICESEMVVREQVAL